MYKQVRDIKSTKPIKWWLFFCSVMFTLSASAQFLDGEVESPIPLLVESVYTFPKVKKERVSDKKIDLNNAFIHQFGFHFTNAAFAPEVAYNQRGNIFIKPTWHYGFEFSFEYNFLFFKKFGITSEFILGFMPVNQVLAHNSNSFNDSLISEYTNGKDFINPQNEFYQFEPAPYVGHRIGATYMISAGKRLVIQPKLSAFFPLFSFVGSFSASSTALNGSNIVWYENNGSCGDCFHPSLPDLTLGLDFQIRLSKYKPQFLLIGLVYNQSFVARIKGNYIVQNMGEGNNSSGNYAFGSTYMGLKVGFVFHKIKPKPTQNSLLFNPRF